VFPSVGHQLHRDRKTAAMPLFTSCAIADAEPMIREQVEKLCNIVHECFVQNKPIELGVLCIALAVDVTFKHIHGEDFGLLKDLDRARNWRDMANAILDITSLIKQFLWAGPYIAQLPVSLLGLVNEHMANASRLQKVSTDERSLCHSFTILLTVFSGECNMQHAIVISAASSFNFVSN